MHASCMCTFPEIARIKRMQFPDVYTERCILLTVFLL